MPPISAPTARPKARPSRGQFWAKALAPALPTPLALLAPAPALAHAGEHRFGFAQNLAHMLTQPDHLLAALAAAVLGYGLFRAVKGRAKR